MPDRNRITLSDRLRYMFDNTMSAGTVALIAWLGVIALILILLAALVMLIAGIGPVDSAQVGFGEAVWLTLVRTLDAGTFGADTGWRFRLLMFVVTLGGIFVVSALIGVLSTGIEQRLTELRKGRSLVLEVEHTLILGWSPKIFTIIAQLVIANENQRKPRIVVLADKDKVEMEDEIRLRAGNLRNTRVICRTGSPIDMTDLAIANPQMAKSIIILSPEHDEPDADVIKTILAITNNPRRNAHRYHIVAEMRELRQLEVAQLVGGDEARFVLASDLISRLTVQASRQSGLSVVYTELLNFAGDEMYFARQPELVGRTFGEALQAFEDTTIIGVHYADGHSKLNAPMDTVIGAEDELIGITEDDSTFTYRPGVNALIDEAALRPAQPRAQRPERTLILGWNERACMIITELNDYVPFDSAVHVVANLNVAETRADCLRRELHNVRLSFEVGDTTNRATLEHLNVPSYDHVILLCYSDDHDPNRADAITLVTLLHLRSIAERSGRTFSLVSEVLDVRNRELADVTHADDFIVSDMLTSLMLAQVSENKHLSSVFEDLFTPEGSEIYLKPMADYVATGQPVNFFTVVDAARRRGEVAIGYRQAAHVGDAAKAYGVVLNPDKSVLVSYAAHDRVILIAES